MEDIVANQYAVLIYDIPLWIIHGIKDYYKTGGVCFIMECRAHANDPASEKVGVTVDLVPVYTEEATYELFDKRAKSFLPYSLNQYAKRGDLYRLLNKRYCDTGLIENLMMNE